MTAVENEFQIGDRRFSVAKINALNQYHIVRRIGPILSDLIPAMASIAKLNLKSLSEEDTIQMFGKLMSPVLGGLSKLSDQDAEYVLFRLLACVQVHQPQFNTWARVATEVGIVMQDIEFPMLIQVAGRALMFNLSGFFDLLPRK